MTTVTLVDGNNYFRRLMEARSDPLRAIYAYSIHLTEPMIWVWDGAGASAARRKIFPGYKVGREKPDPSFYQFQDLAKEIIKLSDAVSIEVPEFEADDVIAAIVRANPEAQFHINTTDGDMGQLVCSRVTTEIAKLVEEPRWIRLYKTFVGDSSDKIPGAKGFGKGTWEKLTKEDKHYLKIYISRGDIRPKDGDFPIPKGVTNWLNSEENWRTLYDFYKIVGFYTVSDELIAKHSVAGNRQPLVVNKILEDLFQ